MSVFLFHLYKTSFSFFLIIKEAGREVTQSYVGGTKRIFLVFFICMNWRPKRRRQGCVRACAGESSFHQNSTWKDPSIDPPGAV